MTTEEINALLYRHLENGFQYDKLIPKYQNIEKYFVVKDKNKFDTYKGLEFMGQWTRKYSYQFKEVAKLLIGKNAEETINNNYKFLYSHFQYHIDKELQNLYAPSAAWFYRKKGIDCKSFSILASCLLLEQGIKHAFRKVKIDYNDYWSHVYVVVFSDNKEYIIDATTHNNREVKFTEKHDYFMDLEYRGLASPYNLKNDNHQMMNCPSMDCGCDNFGLSNPYSFGMSGLPLNYDISTLKAYFSGPISCWGGSAYSPQAAENDLSAVLSVLHGYIDNMNKAIYDNDMQKFSEMVNMFIGVATWNASITGYKIAAQKWNDCTKKNIQGVKKAYDFYRYRVVQALQVWLAKYFTGVENGMKYYGGHIFAGKTNNRYYTTNGELKTAPSTFNVVNTYFGEWVTYESSFLIFGIPYFNFQKKENAIPAFEVTPYVVQTEGNASSFNAVQFLTGLTNIIDSVTPNGNGTGGTGTGTGTTGTGSGNSNYNPETKKAGIGVVAGIGIVLIAGGIYFKNQGDKPQINKNQK